MSESEESRDERIKIALMILRQKVKNVLEHEPCLIDISSLDEIKPKTKQKVVEDMLWSIFCYGEYYVEKLMSDISTPILSVRNKGNFDYYQKTYKPIAQKIPDLIDVANAYSRKEFEIRIVVFETFRENPNRWFAGWSPVILQSDIDNYLNTYHDACSGEWLRDCLDNEDDILNWFDVPRNAPNSIQSNFESVLLLTGGHLESADGENREAWEERIDLSVCENFINKPYFKPDHWVENEKIINPVIVTQEMEKIPIHIKTRMDEIYHSFIFGNWMSAIALSRCLLEYALFHRKSLLAKKLNTNLEFIDREGRTKRISEMASIASDAFPELKSSLEIVIEYGNYVMHPIRRTIPNKNLAKHCIDEIQKIIGVLYRA